MNNRERFLNVMNYKGADDRLPMVEWAPWWDKTIQRWRKEGLPADIEDHEINGYLGLDIIRHFWMGAKSADFPTLEHGCGAVTDENSYESILKYLYPWDAVDKIRNRLAALKPLHENGDVVVWMILEGFFWHPREIFGIERHLYAFYDEPGLMHRINKDLTAYYINLVEEFCRILQPDFMTFAEDMSYNNGPMLSHDLFQEFLLPYYRQIVPVLKKHNIIPMVDTDGQVEGLIPWMLEAGIEGVLPLERQAGVDVARIRKNYPGLKMIGGFDKMVMSRGEEAMRQEFERLLPVMKSGGYIAACDHQTPPGVSLENYKIYLGLMKEYCRTAAE